jgi:hypothetical protein
MKENVKDVLIAKIYQVEKEGKEAYELRMENFGFYIEKAALGSLLDPFLKIGSPWVSRVSVTKTPMTTVPDSRDVTVEGTTAPFEVVYKRPPGRPKKRIYTKRDTAFWATKHDWTKKDETLWTKE